MTTTTAEADPSVAALAGRITAAARRIMASGDSAARAGRDPVNLPMIRNWLEALGDDNPVYERDGLAPPAMIQVWTMRGLRPGPVNADTSDPLGAMSAVLDEAGFTSVVATNCEQTYHRYLRLGEEVAVRSRLTDVVGPKRTALGEGWFVTTRSTWYVGEEPVASMLFRILRYHPASSGPQQTQPARERPANVPPANEPAANVPAVGEVLRPVISLDTAFFWAGTAAGELRIQRCGQCGALRHPPGPACPRCGAGRPEYVVAAGVGTIYSYVVHHHPPVPGRRLPIVVALVELSEGVRMVGELLGVRPDQVEVGAAVTVTFVRIDDDLVLPAWRLGHSRAAQPDDRALPELRIEATPTFVISSAIATRDYQDVHHDRDLAQRRGSRDIFVNILTTTGLVARYVTDWAGPDAVLRGLAIRLGVPCYAYDTLTLTGQSTPDPSEPGGYTVDVVGRGQLGDHVTGAVRVELAGGVA